LPWIGFYFWRKLGFLSGLVAGAIYLYSYYDTADKLLAEPLTAFSLFLIVIAYIFFEIRNDIYSSIILGFIMGLGLLVKGILLFIPVFLFAYFVWKYYNLRTQKSMLNIVVIFSAMVLSILPWSLYASFESHQIILLSTQGGENIMDCNNEYATDGLWHPEWRKDVENSKVYFYNHDEMPDAPAFFRIINFYKSHISLLPVIIKNKIASAYSSFLFFWFMLLLLALGSYKILIGKYFKREVIIYNFYLILAIPFFILGLYFVLHNNNVLIQWIHDNIFVLIFVLLIPLVFNIAREGIFLIIPAVFYMIFINFFLITIIFFGSPRYIGIMDFIIILCAIQSILHSAVNVLSKT
jgi:4-amino-4-deoxy-L-arabinose transferase-like glycosyltransferase